MSSFIAPIDLPYYGRGMVAMERIQPGTIALSKTVDAFTLEVGILTTHCSGCTSEGQKTLRCTACKTIHYCSKTCQKADWPLHKLECKALQASKHNGILPSICRLLIRLYSISLKNPKRIEQLESHRTDFPKVAASWTDAELIASAASHYTKSYQTDFFRSLFCKLSINSMNLVTCSFDRLGVCLDTVLSRINHSCEPNCHIIFEGSRAILVATRQIQKNEQLFISYTDVRLPQSIRQKQLKKKYFFDCECEKCAKESLSGEKDGSHYQSQLKNNRESLSKNLKLAKELWSSSCEKCLYPWGILLHRIKLGFLNEMNYDGAFAALLLKSVNDPYRDAIHVVDEYQLLLLGKQLIMEVKQSIFPNDRPLEIELGGGRTHSGDARLDQQEKVNFSALRGEQHCFLSYYSISLDDLVVWLLQRAGYLLETVKHSHPDTCFAISVVEDVKEFFEVCKDYQSSFVDHKYFRTFETKLEEACKDYLMRY
ncbi:histone lysine methyltransferase Set6 [Schizosaccharomyces cryophilus OY26]|uniref:Histone lysine methyltransferase Set6 n=1 Tax=Schizosaccharomyces cryophilus (strain OY26 / ATCC MYA-4695 / CBS 11777 / NBRC 106824 / NRRL Y48691) TaxID=653667 RepID=S9X948_SCHCR|nr:histone lysine methyltransferase Set6 [Schizosaccharomyces cryophilus OY26]EPY53727.1 histone lysine methyltransferase Set6 [Schizosaccharomyces cryophilus OY26]